MNEAEKKAFEELVQSHCRQLGEHVDSVQIFVSKQNDGGEGTSSYAFGSGNFYTRLGQVSEWVVRQEEYVREEARIQQRKDLED